MSFAMALALVQASSALALSGYASDQSAVSAQYPDQVTTSSEGGGGGVDGTLQSVMATSHRRPSSPRAAAKRRQVQRQINRQARGALSSAAGLTPTQSGSLVLLLAAAFVLSVGAVLRWRRS